MATFCIHCINNSTPARRHCVITKVSPTSIDNQGNSLKVYW
ncbi:hypothetical protein L916_10083 [Phytophthora nicotianae]|uniref:Uncharacterized protein n=1 Tax=Phytophthora nicotianae TaxID=4792 RepID=W2IW28_PHYNI|nr:hypothetical protein L916_10083 [Phytophthora nicotianae]